MFLLMFQKTEKTSLWYTHSVNPIMQKSFHPQSLNCVLSGEMDQKRRWLQRDTQTIETPPYMLSTNKNISHLIIKTVKWQN